MKSEEMRNRVLIEVVLILITLGVSIRGVYQQQEINLQRKNVSNLKRNYFGLGEENKELLYENKQLSEQKQHKVNKSLEVL